MLVLPVLDILEGQVVHGVAGRRTEYRPIVSRLTSSCEPLAVARAIRNTFGLDRYYLADLDGILRQKPNYPVYRDLVDDGFELLVDAGIRNSQDAARVQAAGVSKIVVGLESCRSPADLASIATAEISITFSLDLLSGKPCRREDSIGWSDHPWEIIRQAIHAKAKAILPLDLSDVGMSTGGSTDSLCQFIRNEFPKIHLITGGGVRNPEDLKRLSSLGVDEALVATALHDGRLNAFNISEFA